nr:hypothetical protein [Tanacetum cinerariifolium]
MSNLSKLEFGALNVTGKNYMPWVLDVKMHLESFGISQTIVENNDSPPQDKARENIFLRKHIDDGLKFEYLTTEDPNILWKDLKDRFDNQREVLLSTVREEWRSLRFQDFKKNNKLLMKDHQSRPTRSLTYPEVNATKNDPKSFMCGQGQSHEKGRVQFGKNNYHGHNHSFHSNMKNDRVYTHGRGFTRGSGQRTNKNAPRNNKAKNIGNHKHNGESSPSQNNDGSCFRSSVDLIEGTGKANFILPNGIKFLINNAIFSPKLSRNLLSFDDIYLNGYDTQTTTIKNEKYLHIIDKSNVLEKLPMLHSGLHYTHLSMAESHMVIKEKSCDPGIVSLWHDRLGHPGSTIMKKIIGSTHGNPLKDQKILQMDKMDPCTSCSLGKLIARPSPLKVEKESLVFLERIQDDICRPIHPPFSSDNRPPMFNKENCVPWSSRLLRYAKSRPKGKLIYNSIINGPYVRRMIPKLGGANREVPFNETFHEQTDDELTKKELKQVEADDQAIQTILLGLSEDIYSAVDSCETAQEIWLCVQQMMKGSDIGIQEKTAKLFNEWEKGYFY